MHSIDFLSEDNKANCYQTFSTTLYCNATIIMINNNLLTHMYTKRDRM